MRQRYPLQQNLGTIPIDKVSLDLKSRDELPFILGGLQHIFGQAHLREPILSLLDERINSGKHPTGRPGMELWQILVMGVVRLGLDANYDRLHDLVNNHKSIRGILGIEIERGFGSEKQYSLQSIKDNLALFDEDLLKEINTLVVKAGHKLLKKKAEALCVKADTYVLESNIHYPTDTNLLYDSGRKCLDMVRKLARIQGVPIRGFRKVKYWHQTLRNRLYRASNVLKGGGKNRSVRVQSVVGSYLKLATQLSKKLHDLVEHYPYGDSAQEMAILFSLKHYLGYLDHQIDLVDRRLLQGESIPHEEKIFSIFEPHTEWISKGKAHKKVELGHNILIATDQFHFILCHKVIEKQADVQLALPLAQRICQLYDQDKLGSISFDRGFFSKLNYENLLKYADKVILPKKGKPNKTEQERESEASFVKLRRKHSTVEANINQLEHHGLNRCPDKGLENFKSYAALGVLAYNIHRLGKALMDKEQKATKKLKLKQQKAALKQAA